MKFRDKIWAIIAGLMSGLSIGINSKSWVDGLIFGFIIFDTMILMSLTSETY